MKNQEDLEDYFSKALQLREDHSALSLVQQKNMLLCSQIKSGQQTVNENSLPLKTNPDYKNLEWVHTESINISNKLRNVSNRKMKMKKQLYDIMCQQNDINIDLNLSQVKQKRLMSISRHIKPLKSQWTAEQKENIKKILKRNKKFQRSINHKTVQFYQTIQKQEQKEKACQYSIVAKRKQSRKQFIQQSNQIKSRQKQQLKIRRLQRAKQNREILKQKRMYDQMKQSWKIKENEEQSRKIQMINALKKQRYISFQEIKQHQKRYNETLKERKQSRIRLDSSQVEQIDSKTTNTFSPFLNTLFEQENAKRLQQALKQQQLKKLIGKRKLYAKQVRLNFLPKTKQNIITNRTSQIHQYNKENSMINMHKKGVSYMREVNAQLSKNRRLKPLQNLVTQPKTSKHRNYLAQQRLKKGEGLTKKTDIDEISQIMKYSTLPDDLKLSRAIAVVDKIQNKKYYSKSKLLVDSITAKLQILRQLSPA